MNGRLLDQSWNYKIKIENSKFWNNEATDSGGVFYIQNTNTLITKCIFLKITLLNKEAWYMQSLTKMRISRLQIVLLLEIKDLKREP